MENKNLIVEYCGAIRAMREGRFNLQIHADPDNDIGKLGIELHELARDLEKRFEEVSKLQQLTTLTVNAAAGLFLDDILNRVYESFRPVIPYDRMGCALLNEEKQTLTAYWSRSEAPKVNIKGGYTASIKGSSLQAILATGQPRVLNDLEAYFAEHQNSVHTRLILDEGMRSSLTCPLISQAKPVGFLFFSSMRKNAYQNVHQEIFLLISSQLSVLIEKSRLYQQLHELNKQLQEAQSQLLQSEKMASIGQLAAGVAHEINNPIGYVYANLGALEKYLDDLLTLIDVYEHAETRLPADNGTLAGLRALKARIDLPFLRQDIPTLMRESEEGIVRVKKIVQDLKDFSRVGAEDQWQWADLRKGLDSTLNIVNSELKYKADVVKQYGDIPEIECLPSQLNQVFMNLLVNAGHAIADKGVITVRTGAEGDQVWVEFSDTGKGIAPEHLNRIFDPFFTTKPVGKGTGLGLSLSFGIVQKHGGRIEVQSEVGKGTTFRIWLPVKRAPEQSN